MQQPVRPPRQLACARCGTAFECALDGGCWCAAEPYQLPMSDTAATEDCLCPACLRKAAEDSPACVIYEEPTIPKTRDTAMIDLYALTSPNVQKIFIMLEETGLAYNTKLIDVWKADQFTPEFTKINPLQKVPAIVDHDGPGGQPYTLIESGAILMYLAEKTGKFIPHDPVKRYDTLQWLVVQVANVGPMSGQVVHFSKFAGPGQDYAVSRYRTALNKLYDIYEERLSTRPYVAGDDYTIADIAAFPWLRNVELLAIDMAKRPHVKAWIDKLNARDAVKRAYAKIGAIKSVRDNATDDDKDRYFGRGKYARV